MSAAPDVLVVGGGAIGLAAAERLARDGARVRLLERGSVGRGATYASAGVLAPQHECESDGAKLALGLASHGLWPAFAARIREASGVDPEHRTSGVVYASLSETEQARAVRLAEHHRAAGLATQVLSASDLRRLEPHVTAAASGGVLYAANGAVDAARLADALAVAARRAGAEIVEGLPVTSLAVERRGSAPRVTGVTTPAGLEPAGTVVLAAGAWTAAVAAPAGLSLPIAPVKGQILSLRAGAPLVAHIVFSSLCYLVPRPDGILRVGATLERRGFDERVTAGGVASLLAGATTVVPALSELTLADARAGLRPGTPDGLPILGRPDGWGGLVLAAGHHRNGILLTPVTAEIVAAVVAGARPPVDLEPYRLERFARGPAPTPKGVEAARVV